MLDYALKLTADLSSCTKNDVEELRDAGWSDEDILDIAQVTAMFNFTNRLASGLGWVPNHAILLSAAEEGRVARPVE